MPLLEWLPYVNFGLLLGVIVSLAWLAVSYWRRKSFFIAEFEQMAQELKQDLPPVIVGEILTRFNLPKVEERLGRVEDQANWLQRRFNEVNEEKQPGA